MSPRKKVSALGKLHPARNPNATVGGGMALAGELVVETLNAAGVHVSATVGVAIAAGLCWLGLMIGKDGLKGLAGLIWHGRDN